MIYPTHAIVPESAVGLLVNGRPMAYPFQKIPVGNGWAHVPILYREGDVYELAERPAHESVDSFGDALDIAFFAFRNGAECDKRLSTVEADGPASIVSRHDGDGWRATVRLFDHVKAGRIQFNMTVPAGDTSDMGIGFPSVYGQPVSNVGNAPEAYNRSRADSPWDGWVACGGLFLSIRYAHEKFPRGFKYDPATGTLKLFLHFENGERTSADTFTYDRIAHLDWAHRGKLNLKTPEGLVAALNNDPRIKSQVTEVSPQSHADADPAGASCTLEILAVSYSEANGLDAPDFQAWHEMHQRGPNVSLVKVQGMPDGKRYLEQEAKVARDLLGIGGEFFGQFLWPDCREADGTLYRVRNLLCHYRTPSHAWIHALRTGNPELLVKARAFHEHLRDVQCRRPGEQAHPKGVLPWMGDSDAGHWHNMVEANKWAWLIDGDYLSRDKLMAWKGWQRLGSLTDREAKATLVQSRIFFDFIGQPCPPIIEETQRRLEATPLNTQDPGRIWDQRWESDEYAKQQAPLIQYENWFGFHQSLQQGKPELMLGVADRLPKDHPEPQRPGPDGEGGFIEAWPEFREALEQRGIDVIPPCEEMGDYPCLPTYISPPMIGTAGAEIRFTKPDDKPFDLTLTLHTLHGDNDVPATLVRYRLARNSTPTVLQAAFPIYRPTGGLLDGTPVVRPSGRDGVQKTWRLTLPAGEYSLLLNGTDVGCYGPITPWREYSLVQANARSGMHEGWFKDKATGETVWFRNGRDGIAEFDRTLGLFMWKRSGFWSARKEWLS